MSVREHFIFGKCIEFTWQNFFGWCFFLSSIAISTVIIMINPTSINYGRLGNGTKLLFIISISFIGAFIGRCVCYKKPVDENELPNVETNLLKFREAEQKFGVV